jgi:hypothetical protein
MITGTLLGLLEHKFWSLLNIPDNQEEAYYFHLCKIELT